MKISEMSTDQAADVLVKIAEPVQNIMHDEEFTKLLERLANGDDNALKFIGDNIVPLVNVAIKTHRKDAYTIIGALAGKTPNEIGKQSIGLTIKDIKESLDGDLISFFGSSK